MATVLDQLTAAATGALPTFVRQVTFVSNFAPPVTFDVATATTAGPPSPLASATRPTLILSGGSLGTKAIAPYGQADPNAWKLNLGLLAVAAGIFGAALVMSIYHVGVFRGRHN